MSDRLRNSLTTPGFFQGITNRVKLIARLMADRRVNPLIKALPVGALIYLIVPTDLMPLIPLDDAAVLWLGTYLFVEMCPPDVVQEHLRAIEGKPPSILDDEPDIIEGEFRDPNP